MSNDFDFIMERVLYGPTQRKQSEKLRNIAKKITKTPTKIVISIEYIIGDEK